MTVDVISESKAKFAKLSARAFEIFGEDLSCMFRAALKVQPKEDVSETPEGLRKRFAKIAAVTAVHAEGSLNGTYALIFDQDALFTIAGTIVMQPKPRILENRKGGSLKEALDLQDAFREAGNLFVGSWNRTFHGQWQDPVHLHQTATWIGDPWNELFQTMGVSPSEALMLLMYEVTLNDFSPFKCGVVLPDAVLNAAAG